MKTTTRAFTWTPCNEDALSSIDLRNVAWYGTETAATTDEDVVPHVVMMCGSIAVEHEPGTAEFLVVYLEREQSTRIGIAWGSYPEWGDFQCDDGNDTPAFAAELEQCIDEYLNDWDDWSARN